MCGYFADESLTEAERVGEALRAAAKYAPIDFSPELLPAPSLAGKLGLSEYTPSMGLRLYESRIDAAAKAHPEFSARLLAYREKIKLRDEAQHRLLDPITVELSASGANRGGHSNPDYGKIVNFGTEHVRATIEKYAKLNPREAAFYRSCTAAMDALDILGERYRLLALRRAENESDDGKRRLYSDMAHAFGTVPRRAAYDFTSAVCAFMLVFALDGNDSPGPI